MAKVLLLKGKAGLGNRLLSLLGSVVYARLSERQLYVDWSDRGYSGDRTNSFARFFSQPVLPDPAPILASDDIAPAVWRGQLGLSVDELMERHERCDDADERPAIAARYTIGFASLDYPQAIAVRWAWTDDIDVLFRCHRTALGPLARDGERALLRRTLSEEVSLTEELSARVDEFQARNFSDVTVGMHIRHSDRRNPHHHYPALLDRILARHPGATVFLATDNQEIEAYYRDHYRQVVTANKWFAPSGTPLHRTRGCPDKFTLGADALVEMYLLGRCQHLVYNRTSSFGVMASLLSGALPEHIHEMSTPWQRARTFLSRLTRPVRATAVRVLGAPGPRTPQR